MNISWGWALGIFAPFVLALVVDYLVNRNRPAKYKIPVVSLIMTPVFIYCTVVAFLEHDSGTTWLLCAVTFFNALNLLWWALGENSKPKQVAE